MPPLFIYLNRIGNIENITINKENKSYSIVDGNLYNKDKTILVKYINENEGTIKPIQTTKPAQTTKTVPTTKRIRAYKTVKKRTSYGAWSKAKKVKIRK